MFLLISAFNTTTPMYHRYHLPYPLSDPVIGSSALIGFVCWINNKSCIVPEFLGLYYGDINVNQNVTASAS